MNKKSTIAFSALAFTMLLASCSSAGDNLDPTTKELPKEVDYYNTIYSTDPKTLASYATNEQPNSQHIANFIDGLVENDNYGRLVPALAKSIPTMVTNSDGTATFTFELKDNLTWAKWSGDKLVPAAKVKAQDFVTAAKLALNPQLEGGSSYLYFTFITGSEEYYKMQVKPKGNPDWKAPTKDELDAAFAEKVGIKAIGDNKIEYTTIAPMDYFPTVLTYACYFPVPTELYNSITSNYGKVDSKARENLWYNGAFALSDMKNNSSIKYVKNPHYWDKDNVKLNNVKFIFAPQDADMSWARQQFEAGNIDSFRVQEIDKAGWKNLVEGPDKSGSLNDPFDPFTNSLESVPDPGTFYLGFNFHRTLRNNTDLPDKAVDDFEKAISNVNFRKAVLYAVDKGEANKRYTPSNPYQWAANLYTTSTLAVDDNGKDYVDYVIDEFATREGMTVAEAKAKISNGTPGVMDPVKAKEYLAKAISELDGKVEWPIKFEIQQRQNQQLTGYYNAFADALQENIDPDKSHVLVSTKQLTNEQANNAFFHYDSSVSTDFGWSPDYGDPMSFLGTLIKGGDLTPNMGLDSDTLADPVIGEYDKLVRAATKITDKSEKFKAYAKAEYELLFGSALMIPLTQPLQGRNVTVTKVRPKTGQLAPYGVGRDKLKGTVVYEHKLNKVQFKSIIDEYEAGKNK